MYPKFFKLAQLPFSIAPDPRYLFMSERHREALAHLLYGAGNGGGFVLLSGEIGAGKTTICRCFLEQVPPNCRVAYIFNPKLTVNDLLRTICEEFDCGLQQRDPGAATVKDYVDALNKYLLGAHAQGQSNLLVIDEAQNLSTDVLEQLRLLTNLETNTHKLLQIILIGQPELRTLLARPELEQLAQRVIARYHLAALSQQETAAYIQHRLTVAGLTSASPFQPRVIKQIHRLSGGIPRRINLLCDRALLAAYAESKLEVDRDLIQNAAAEVFGNNQRPAPAAATPGGSAGASLVAAQRWRYALWSLLVGAAAAGTTTWAMHGDLRMTISNAELFWRSAASQAKPRPAPAGAPIPVSLSVRNAAPELEKTAAQDVAAQPAATVAPWDVDESVNSSLADRAAAFQQMAQLWGDALDSGLSCTAAQKQHLHCYIGRGGLDELRRLNRPAILTLRDASRKIYYALLTGLSDDSATLRVGSATTSMRLDALAPHFDGAFITFWRAPENYRELVKIGDRGPEVDWISQRLAQLNGAEEPLKSHLFDQKMFRQVAAFQRAQKLAVDGVVGPKTFMQLNRAAHFNEPRLLNSAAASTSSSKE